MFIKKDQIINGTTESTYIEKQLVDFYSILRMTKEDYRP